VISPTTEGVSVAILGVKANSHPMRRISPLALEVFGRRDDGDAIDDPTGDELGRESEREGGLACPWSCGREKVPRLGLEVDVEGLGLPGAKAIRGAANGSLRIRG
jgi:hypothetical protein